MIQKQPSSALSLRRHSVIRNQQGSILTAALGVVALVSVLSFSTYNLLTGPVKSAARVTLTTKARSEMMTNARLLMKNAADIDDADTLNEPPSATANALIAASTLGANAGVIPPTVSALTNDPWRTPYGYCVWNVGTTNAVIAGGKYAGLVTGFDARIVLALVSAGPDRVFATTCASDPAYVTPGGDDIIEQMTFNEAIAAAQLWKTGTDGIETQSAAEEVGIGAAATAGVQLTVANTTALQNLTVSGTIANGTFPGTPLVLNDDVTVNGSMTLAALNGTPIGTVTPSTGSFTTLATTSTALVANLNADRLDGQEGSYYLNAANLTGTLDPNRLPVIAGDITLTRVDAANATASVVALRGRALSATVPLNGQVLQYDTGTTSWVPVSPGGFTIAGDVTGTLAASTVARLQGRDMLNTAPAANTVLGWNGSAWAPMTLAPGSGSGTQIGFGGVNYLATATTITSGACNTLGFVPKSDGAGGWTCSADATGAAVTGGTLALPINADNATAPTGMIINSTAGADNFLRFNTTDENLMLGRRAGQNLVAGATRNTIIGQRAGIGGVMTNAADNNTLIGFEAGRDLTSADSNIFIGVSAGRSTTTGGSNIAIGNDTFITNTTGQLNLMIGNGAGRVITVGSNNTVVGNFSGGLMTTANNNTVIGTQAGRSMDTQNGNVYVGNNAGSFNRGEENLVTGTDAGVGTFGLSTYNRAVVLGGNAGRNLTTGNENVLIGYQAGRNITSGGINTFIGTNAGQFATSASRNVGIGQDALRNLSTAQHNVVVGPGAGSSITGGSDNVMLGNSAGSGITTGASNIIIGGYAGRQTDTQSNNIYMGYEAGDQNKGFYNIVIGNTAGKGVISTSTYTRSVVIGHDAAKGLTTGNDNVLIGDKAGRTLTTTGDVIMIGSGAGEFATGGGQTLVGRNAGRNATGGENSLFGAGAGENITTGAFNVMMGFLAGHQITTGRENIIIGGGYPVSTGTKNASWQTYVGSKSGVDARGDFNSCLGFNSCLFAQGGGNTAVGSAALEGQSNAVPITGGKNTALGGDAGKRITAADDNIFLGHGSGTNTTSGDENIIIGKDAAATLTTGSRNVVIGVSVNVPAAGTNDYLVIGNTQSFTQRDAIRGTINSGNLSAQGAAWAFHSDRRLKKDIRPVRSVLHRLNTINGVVFKWNGISNSDTTKDNYGVIAQEVQKAFPELVSPARLSANGKNYLQVDIDGFIPILIEAIKEQQMEIKQQQNDIDDLKRQIDDLRTAINEIKSAQRP